MFLTGLNEKLGIHGGCAAKTYPLFKRDKVPFGLVPIDALKPLVLSVYDTRGDIDAMATASQET